MKRMVALLMVLTLLSGASLGFTEETNTDWKEHLSTAVEGLQEAGEKAAEVITEKTGQLSETVSGTLGTVADKVEEYADRTVGILRTAQLMTPFAVEMGKQAVVGKVKDLSAQASEIWEDAKTALPQYVERAGDAASGMLNQLSEQAGNIWTNVKETVPQYAEKAMDTAGEKLEELSQQVADILASMKSAAGQIRDIAGQKAGEIAEKAGGIAQTAKELAFSALSSAGKAAVEKLQALVKWLKGGETPAAPDSPSSPDGGAPTEDQETASPQAFYPLPGYDFYFGMSWKDAQALHANWLNDSRADAYERARALVMLNEQKTSLYFLWFAGETEDATLFEVDEFAFAAEDTLVSPQDANGQYSFITTDTTVKQVYAEKERSCEQRFGAASSLESGLLVSSLMFNENDAGISQAQVHMLQNAENVFTATHFVFTTDCGVNVIIYQYI